MAREPKCPIAGMVCPRNSDPQRGKYCPAWTEYVETNTVTREERMHRECMFQALPKFMVEVCRTNERPAAAVESTRNEIANGFNEINRHMQRIPALLLENRGDDRGEG